MLIDLGLPTRAADGHPMAGKVIVRIGFNFKEGRLQVAGMKLDQMPVIALGFMGNSNPLLEGALPGSLLGGFAVGLRYDHVAAIATASIKISTRGGAFLDRRHHFQKVSADWH